MKTSEYVSIGHPDKTADYISEYILDRMLEQDENTRYALEVQIKNNYVTISGELTTNANVNIEKAVVDAINAIGYTQEYAQEWGEYNTLGCEPIQVVTHINQQSNDIAQGVNTQGWGDQGIFYGIATNTPETDYMPADYYYAKKLCQRLYNAAKFKKIGGLDIKTQVTTDEDGEIKNIIVAIPMLEKHTTQPILDIINETFPLTHANIIINGTGKYVKHSSYADCGTTGRKLAVDFYGGNCVIGGGSPWTKDGTKADLTLNMLARKIALDTIKSNKRLQFAKVALACCIGKSEVICTIYSKYDNVINQTSIDLPPETIIQSFGLRKPKFAQMCKDGLFTDIK